MPGGLTDRLQSKHMVKRAHVLLAFGLRTVYLFVPLTAWLFGPTYLLLFAAAMVGSSVALDMTGVPAARKGYAAVAAPSAALSAASGGEGAPWASYYRPPGVQVESTARDGP